MTNRIKTALFTCVLFTAIGCDGGGALPDARAIADAAPTTDSAQTCLEIGGPCCAGDVCDGTFRECVAGMCEACGIAGLPACGGTECRHPYAVLDVDQCVSCGAVDEPCCGSETDCAAGFCRDWGKPAPVPVLSCENTNTECWCR